MFPPCCRRCFQWRNKSSKMILLMINWPGARALRFIYPSPRQNEVSKQAGSLCHRQALRAFHILILSYVVFFCFFNVNYKLKKEKKTWRTLVPSKPSFLIFSSLSLFFFFLRDFFFIFSFYISLFCSLILSYLEEHVQILSDTVRSFFLLLPFWNVFSKIAQWFRRRRATDWRQRLSVSTVTPAAIQALFGALLRL